MAFIHDKKYYLIGEVSRELNIDASTLRYWEREFTHINPHTSKKGTRLYTPKDIEAIKMVYHLLRDRGLSIEAAKRTLKQNPDGEERRVQVLSHLQAVRDRLSAMYKALDAIDEPETKPHDADYD